MKYQHGDDAGKELKNAENKGSKTPDYAKHLSNQLILLPIMYIKTY